MTGCTQVCNQGRDCTCSTMLCNTPAAREAGNVCIATPEPSVMDALFFYACVTLSAVISTAVIFGVTGWLWRRFGEPLQHLFWTAMNLWF